MNFASRLTLLVVLISIHGCISITPRPAKLPQMLCLPPVFNTCEKTKEYTVGILRIDLPSYVEQSVLFSKISSCEIKLHENFEWCEPINLGICRTIIAHLNNSSDNVNFEALPSKGIQAYSNYVFLEFNDFAYYTNEANFKIAGKITIYDKSNSQIHSNYFNIQNTIKCELIELPKAISTILKELAEYVILELKSLNNTTKI